MVVVVVQLFIILISTCCLHLLSVIVSDLMCTVRDRLLIGLDWNFFIFFVLIISDCIVCS